MFLDDKKNFAMLLLLEKYIKIKIDKYLFEAKDSYNKFKITSKTSNILLEINCFSDLGERIINIINKIIFTELEINDNNNHKKLLITLFFYNNLKIYF